MGLPRLVDPADLPDAEASRQYARALEEGGVDLETLALDDKGTLAVGTRSRGAGDTGPGAGSGSGGGTDPQTGSTGQRRLLLSTTSGDSEITLTGSLSKGGMGEVMLARQASLHREVAVKVLKNGAHERAADLVIEARIAANLEHPNIVPVHVLGADAEGRPMLVMKRVEGESWRTILSRQRDLARDLQILMEVCRALHFAHSRGVAHCDVKPTNVMVGRFGEVYLVDWGIAVGFGDCAIPDVPHATTIKGVFGTPKYMAPEMALPGSPIDHRTDIFVVGAVLYELVTGRLLRRSARIDELLFMAHRAPAPDFPETVDDELRAICLRALARDPADRFQSMDDLRQALLVFQTHAAARAMIAEGEAQARAHAALVVTPTADDRTVRATFLESRFAFQAALRQWPESGRARAALDDVIARMIEWEVGRDELASAKALLAELAAPPSSVVAAVEGLAAAHAERHRAHRELAQRALQQDRRVAERERATFVFGSAVGWLLTMVALHALAARGVVVVGPAVFAVFMVAFAAVLIAAGLLIPALRPTEASRAMWITMQATVIGLACLHTIGWAMGIDAATMLALGHTLLAVTAAQLAAADRRLWAATAMSVLSIPVLLGWPAHAVITSGVVGFLMLGDIARRWRHTDSR